jgi:Asp/Glu/hydantoin racemase
VREAAWRAGQSSDCVYRKFVGYRFGSIPVRWNEVTSHILLINPNTSADMTRLIVEQASKHAPANVAFDSVTASFGTEVIASRASYAIAAHAALDCFARHEGLAAGIIVACFGDPGVHAIRELTSVPVIGLAEASVRVAGRRKLPFAIVTAGLTWKPMLTEFVALMPEVDLFTGVYCIDATGIVVTREPERFAGLIAEQIRKAQMDGAETVILGGAALAGFASRLDDESRLIDCVAAAVTELLTIEGASRSGKDDPPSLPSIGLTDELARLLGHGKLCE